jgi:hypothetical protein
MTARICAVDGGTYYHHEALHGTRYRGWFDRLIDLRRLPQAELTDCDVLVVTCRSHPGPLRAARERFARFLAAGGTVVAMGETQSHTWLPRVSWSHRPTNFWWWLERGASPGYVVAAPAHPLFRHLTLADATWHYHGVFAPPAGATALITLEADGGCLLYEDEVSTAGRMIVTSLDPFYHHGSHFMPATTRFLDGFLPWLASLQRRALPQPCGGLR